MRSVAGRPPLGNKPRRTMTITIAHETVESLDSMAFVEGVSRSQLIDRAIRELFERLEKERGEPYPQR